MAKLADAPDLKSVGLILRVGSNPTTRTKIEGNAMTLRGMKTTSVKMLAVSKHR